MQQNTLPSTQTPPSLLRKQTTQPITETSGEPSCITYMEHTLILVDTGTSKSKVLKALCTLLGCDLHESKKLINTCPVPLLEGASRTTIDEWTTLLQAAGATIRVITE